VRTQHPEILLVAHPSCLSDERAAPWIHLSGVLGGLLGVGQRARLVRFPVLERAFAGGGRVSRALRWLVEVVLPFAVFRACVSRAARPYVRHYHDMSLAYFLLWLFRVPFAVEVNATLEEEPHAFARAPEPLRRLVGAIELAAIRKAGAVVAVSGVLRNRLVGRGCDPSRVVVVHNGVGADDACGSSDGSPGSGIVYVGNFKAWHGVGILVEAFARVAGSLGDNLLLVGKGDAGRIRARAEELGVDSRVRLVGQVDHGEATRLMRCSRMLVLPNTADYGSPMKVFEYLASGRPTVLPDFPNIREIVGDGEHALLFEPANVGALSSCLMKLASDPDLAATLGRRGRELVCREHTWERNAERIIDALSALA
jgi:glycosyltransferase involved in cell wall biosynthesis